MRDLTAFLQLILLYQNTGGSISHGFRFSHRTLHSPKSALEQGQNSDRVRESCLCKIKTIDQIPEFHLRKIYYCLL